MSSRARGGQPASADLGPPVGLGSDELTAYHEHLQMLRDRVRADRSASAASTNSTTSNSYSYGAEGGGGSGVDSRGGGYPLSVSAYDQATTGAQMRAYENSQYARTNAATSRSVEDPRSESTQQQLAPSPFLAEKKALLEVIDHSAQELERLRRSNSEIESQRREAREELDRLRSSGGGSRSSSGTAQHLLRNSQQHHHDPQQQEFRIRRSSSAASSTASDGNGGAGTEGGNGGCTSYGKYQAIVVEMESLSAQNVALQKEKTELQGECSQRLRVMSGQLEQLETQLNEALAAKDIAETKSGLLTTSVQEAEQALRAVDQKNSDLSLELEEVHRMIDTRHADDEKLKATLATLKDESSQREQLISFQDGTINDLDRQLGIATSAAAEWEERFKEMQAAVDKVHAETDQRTTDAVGASLCLMHGLATVLASLASATPQHGSDEADSHMTPSEENEEGESIDGSNESTLTAAVHHLTRMHATLLKEHDPSSVKCVAAFATLDETLVSNAVSDAVGLRLDLAQRDHALCGSIEEYRVQSTEMLEELEVAREEKAELAVTVERLHAELYHERSTVAALRGELDGATGESQKQRSTAAEELDIALLRLDETEAELETVKLDCRTLASKNDTLSATVEDLRAKLSLKAEDHKFELRQLKNELEETKKNSASATLSRRGVPTTVEDTAGSTTRSNASAASRTWSPGRVRPADGSHNAGGGDLSPKSEMKLQSSEIDRLRNEVRRLKLQLADAKAHSAAASRAPLHTTPGGSSSHHPQGAPLTPTRQLLDESSIVGVTELSPTRSSVATSAAASPSRYHTTAGGGDDQNELVAKLRQTIKNLTLERDVALQRAEAVQQTLDEERDVTVAAMKRQVFLLQKEAKAREAKHRATEQELRHATREIHKLEDALDQHRKVLDFLSTQKPEQHQEP